ncbi:MAG TPA: hypothetical protein VD927_02360 [Chryseosolibacter sp.]|nr:hypothetical protein [Chryseosolibacter sp.]
MTTNSLNVILIVVLCIILIPVGFGIIGGAFGILAAIIGGLFSVIFAVIGSVFGAVFSVIGWLFDLITGCFWSDGILEGNAFTIFVLVVLVIVLSRNKNRK